MEDRKGNLMKWICVFFSGILSVTAIDVQINHEVTIQCPLPNVEYPTWTGPTNLVLTNEQTINEPGFEWVNKKDLKIASAQTKHTGEYKCASGDSEGLAQLNVITYDVTVEFLNVDVEEVTGTERLIGENNKNMTVTCQVKGGNPAPNVTFTFGQNVQNPPDVSQPTITDEVTEVKTHNVNASVTFNASDALDYKFIKCTASFGVQNFTDKEILLYLLYPPTLLGHGTSQFPSWENRTMKSNCYAWSRPETTFNWIIDGKNISDSDFDITEDQSCTQNSTTYKYECQSNITISNLEKEDNGKEFRCEYLFQGETVATADPTRISLPFPSTKTTISGNTTGVVVDSSGTATITLTCSADSSNPVSKLVWFIGRNERISSNAEFNSTYTAKEMDELYDGKNVTQDIDVQVNRSMNGEMISCCVFVLTEEICDSVTLDVKYPPLLLAPQLAEYRAYVGDNMSIPCIADSSPASNIAWYRMEGQTSTHFSNNTNIPTNIFYLEIVDVKMDDAVDYECKAWLEEQGIAAAVSKSTKLIVLDKPPEPEVGTAFDADNYYIEIKTGEAAPDIPRTFYIQYKRQTGVQAWLEIDKAFVDTLPGQESQTYNHSFQKGDLLADTEYEMRIKSVDHYGLVSYSEVHTFRTDKLMTSAEDDMVSMRKYRNAIIISVFVTAGVFLIIIIGITCAVKSGKCMSSSSKSYVM